MGPRLTVGHAHELLVEGVNGIVGGGCRGVGGIGCGGCRGVVVVAAAGGGGDPGAA
jgi:hypothetical protein